MHKMGKLSTHMILLVQDNPILILLALILPRFQPQRLLLLPAASLETEDATETSPGILAFDLSALRFLSDA